MYRRAIERDPGHFATHMNLGLVAERLGDTRGAIAHYRDFLAAVPPDPAYDTLKRQAHDAMALLRRTPDRGGREAPPSGEVKPRG
jgi:regulator of sirC expression with transglutaminase-like and TPR domain